MEPPGAAEWDELVFAFGTGRVVSGNGGVGGNRSGINRIVSGRVRIGEDFVYEGDGAADLGADPVQIDMAALLGDLQAEDRQQEDQNQRQQALEEAENALLKGTSSSSSSSSS